MPKENINCVASDELRAEVSWRTDREDDGAGYVQLATVHTNSPATMPNAPETAKDLDQELPPETLDGWHVTLNREQINRLIRVLRRARDAAFGQDA